MFKIGEFSKLCGLSADTLYHYEQKDVLPPASIDHDTGYRHYDAAQLVAVNKILALKDAGFSLSEMAALMRTEIPLTQLIGMLEDKASSLESALLGETNRLERLRTNIFLIKNGGIPCMHDISIKKVEPILIASIRRTIPKADFDSNCGKMWPAVNNCIKENGIKRSVPCLMIVYSGFEDRRELNLPYDEQILTIEVAEQVASAFADRGEVKVYTLPKVDKMACIVHNGSFSSIPATYTRLYEWMRYNQYQANGPLREIYHKGDWATDNPNEYVTELQIPLK